MFEQLGEVGNMYKHRTNIRKSFSFKKLKHPLPHTFRGFLTETRSDDLVLREGSKDTILLFYPSLYTTKQKQLS